MEYPIAYCLGTGADIISDAFFIEKGKVDTSLHPEIAG